MVLTPDGKIAQYYYGVEYAPKDLRLGLIQASENKIGTLADQVLQQYATVPVAAKNMAYPVCDKTTSGQRCKVAG